jgi:hypothetical protein
VWIVLIGEGIVVFDAACRHQFRAFDIVEDDRQIGATTPKVEDVVELVPSDADRVEQVIDTLSEEIVWLFRVKIVIGFTGPLMTWRATSMHLVVLR